MMGENPWRYRCPKGHTYWERRAATQPDNQPEGQYYCPGCFNEDGADPHFDELVDMKDPAERHITDPEVTAV